MSLYNDGGTIKAVNIWDGAATTFRDLGQSVGFHVDFEVLVTLAADTVFEFVEADALASNSCVYDPATVTPVLEGVLCDPAAVASNARITLPAGTVAGRVCYGRPRCFSKRFVGLVAVSGGTANVSAVAVFSRQSSV